MNEIGAKLCLAFLSGIQLVLIGVTLGIYINDGTHNWGKEKNYQANKSRRKLCEEIAKIKYDKCYDRYTRLDKRLTSCQVRVVEKN